MSKRVIFSEDYPELVAIGELYVVSIRSMEMHYSPSNTQFDSRFQFYSREEVKEVMESRIEEIEISLTFTLLASIEASFRVDYLWRCYRKMKDPLSRNFYDLHKKKGNQVSLKDDLLNIWKEHGSIRISLLGDIKSAFNYRDWLAHGRYWVPKLGRRYDFPSIYDLALDVDKSILFEKP